MGFVRSRAWVLVAAWATACVKDPEIEDEKLPGEGVSQPTSTGSTTIDAAEACRRLADALTAARSSLGCEGEAPVCPGFVHLAGATPCDEYDESTVDACVEAIAGYGSCADFSAHPCVATVVVGSCRAAVVPDGGPDSSSDASAPDGASPDGGGTLPEASTPDASSPDGGSVADGASPDGGAADGAVHADASPSDAGPG